MKITIIVIVNENAHSQTNSSSKQFVIFRAFNTLSAVYMTLKTNAKNSPHFHVLHFQRPRPHLPLQKYSNKPASNLVLMRYSRGGATSGCDHRAVGVRVRVRDD